MITTQFTPTDLRWFSRCEPARWVDRRAAALEAELGLTEPARLEPADRRPAPEPRQ